MRNADTHADADAELRRRRERGKVAQREFRQRQAQSTRKLKDDHDRLKRLVTEIVQASRSPDPALLSVAISHAAGAIGFNSRDDAEADADTSGPSWNSVGSRTNPPALSTTAEQTPEHLSWRTDCPVGGQMSQSRSGRLSPRFDYGIWLDPDRFLKIFEPPLDIAPYVGAGSQTIAGHIAWACMDFGYACLQEAMQQHLMSVPTNSADPSPGADVGNGYPSMFPPNSAARRLFDLSLRHSEPLHQIDFLAAMLEARMEFRRLGYMRADNPGADSISQQVLEGRVAKDLSKRGIRRDHWWSALDIERFVQQEMGMDEFSAFQKGLSKQHQWQIELLEPFAQMLAPRAVCFGDGPRWNAGHIKMLAPVWVSIVVSERRTTA